MRTPPAIESLVAAAREIGATVVESAGAIVLVVPTTRAVDPDELIPVVEAARIAATSLRTVRDAIRSGVLPAVGKQRDRAVRRRDLDVWNDSRRAPVKAISKEHEDEIEAILRRQAKERAA